MSCEKGGLEGVGEAGADGVVVLAGGGVGVGVPFFLRGAFGAGGGAADLVGGEEGEARGDVAAQAYFSAVGEGEGGVVPFGGVVGVGGGGLFRGEEAGVAFPAFEAAGEDADVGAEVDGGACGDGEGVAQAGHEGEVCDFVVFGVGAVVYFCEGVFSVGEAEADVGGEAFDEGAG